MKIKLTIFRKILAYSFLILCLNHTRIQAKEIDLPQDLKELIVVLEKSGYKVLFKNPPIKGAYGALKILDKTMWVAPITMDLGVLRQTLQHEATHAAQGCPEGKLEPIGWEMKADPAVEREIEAILWRKYPTEKWKVEREAFYMQGQENASIEIIKALRERCGKKTKTEEAN